MLFSFFIYCDFHSIEIKKLKSHFFFNRGEHCGGCRRSNSTERPHAFQVILTDRPPLELSANDEQDMAEWMQLLCQSVSKGVRGLLVIMSAFNSGI